MYFTQSSSPKKHAHLLGYNDDECTINKGMSKNQVCTEYNSKLNNILDLTEFAKFDSDIIFQSRANSAK